VIRRDIFGERNLLKTQRVFPEPFSLLDASIFSSEPFYTPRLHHAPSIIREFNPFPSALSSLRPHPLTFPRPPLPSHSMPLYRIRPRTLSPLTASTPLPPTPPPHDPPVTTPNHPLLDRLSSPSPSLHPFFLRFAHSCFLPPPPSLSPFCAHPFLYTSLNSSLSFPSPFHPTPQSYFLLPPYSHRPPSTPRLP